MGFIHNDDWTFFLVLRHLSQGFLQLSFGVAAVELGHAAQLVQGLPIEVAGRQSRIGDVENAIAVGVQSLAKLADSGRFAASSITGKDAEGFYAGYIIEPPLHLFAAFSIQ